MDTKIAHLYAIGCSMGVSTHKTRYGTRAKPGHLILYSANLGVWVVQVRVAGVPCQEVRSIARHTLLQLAANAERTSTGHLHRESYGVAGHSINIPSVAEFPAVRLPGTRQSWHGRIAGRPWDLPHDQSGWW